MARYSGNGSYYTLLTKTYEIKTSTADITGSVMSIPISLNFSGYLNYITGNPAARTTSGYEWMSGIHTNNFGRRLIIDTKSINTQDNIYKGRGNSVRRVAKSCYNFIMKKGKIIPNGVILEKHEYKTVLFFTDNGEDVELIHRSNQKGIKTPDLILGKEKWEMKSPKGEGKYLMQNTLQKAARQSKNVIVDLRRVKRNETKCISELEKEFKASKSIKKLKIITKKQITLDLKKQ